MGRYDGEDYTADWYRERELERCEEKVRSLRRILADREAELLEVKGLCSNEPCSLHYAHSGPCKITKSDNKKLKQALTGQEP